MTQYVINIGAIPNDGTGDPLRTAFNETNLNFDQVFAAGPVLSNIQIANNSILTTNTNGNLVLVPNGIGIVQANASIVPNTANIRNLGSATRRWSTVYTQYVDISGPVSLSQLTVTGNLTVNGNIIQIGNLVTDAKTIQLANTASTANAANGSGITVGANDDIATMLYSSATNAWTFNIGVDTPNIVVNNISSDDSTFVTVQEGLNVDGEIESAGNVTAPYFFGNGSQLTGISSYSNANAVAYGESGWAGNIIPNGNAVYSLGNSTNQWNDLYVSNTTIFMNNVPITLGAGNVLSVNGNAVLQNNSNSTITTTGNITSGNVLTGGIVSATGNITGNYFIGNGSQLSGLSTNSISNGNSNVSIATANGPVTVSYAGSGNTWTFGNVNVPEALYWPDGSFQATAFVGIAQDLANPGNATITSNNTGNTTYAWNFGTDGRLTFPGTPRIDTDSDNFKVQAAENISLEANAVVNIYTDTSGTTYQWQFGDSGDLSVPGDVQFADGSIITDNLEATGNFGISTAANVGFMVDTNEAAHTWTFGADGNLDLPNGGSIIVDGGDGVVGPDGDNMVISWDNEELILRSVGGDVDVEADTDFNIRVNHDGGAGDYLSKWVFGQDNEIVNITGNSAIVTEAGNLNLQGGRNTLSSGNVQITAVDNGVAVNTWTFDNTGNLTAPGNITTTGNITGNYIIGDGSQLTNISGTIANVVANVITFNTAAAVSVAPGQMAWNSTDGTVDIGIGYGNVVLQTGQETHYVVRNDTGNVIENGTSVYCSGVTAGSGRIEVSPFTANGSISPVQFLGLATQDINNGVNGVVTWFGYVRGLDTRGTANTAISVGDETWAVGDKLYAHPTAAGKLTNVVPEAPNAKICVCVIITRNQNSGILFVRPTTNLDITNLSDVEIATPASNEFLTYVGNRWENTALDISVDTSPALGGNLAGAGFSISNVGNITTTGNIVTGGQIQSSAFTGGNISWSANNQTDFQGAIKVGGTGRLLSPGGAASITLNNNGANIPTLGVTIGTAATSTTTGALIVTGGAGLTGNVYAGGQVVATGNITGGNIITAGNVSGNTAGYAIGYRDIPQISFTGNATIATTDAGKHFYSTQSTDYILTIANNASQGFQVGAAITVVNQGTGNITIAQGSGVTLYLAGNASSGNRSVATFGMATIMKVATDTWFISGAGVA